MIKTIIFLAGLTLIFSFANAETVDEDPRKAKAEQLSAQLMKQLKKELMTGLERGAAEAIKVCQLRAPQISKKLSTADVKIGRASHRPRNPDNALQNWQIPLMDEYLNKKEPQPAKSLLLDDGRFAYVKPIYMAPICLRCHGDKISPPLLEKIRSLYPHDQAHGFKFGEFRGLTWVIID